MTKKEERDKFIAELEKPYKVRNHRYNQKEINKNADRGLRGWLRLLKNEISPRQNP